MTWFYEHPGRIYVIATLIPLGVATAMLIAGGVRFALRANRQSSALARLLYWCLGGDKPLRSGGYLAVAGMLASAGLGVFGLGQYLYETKLNADVPEVMEMRWAERVEWVRLGAALVDDRPALSLELGYRIDHLTAVLFAMVTVIASCIFVFALGYMREEGDREVIDHVEHVQRRGRFGRFYLYLSLFAFSMLNLLIADNLFQVFVSWELVGVCSFFLIGFYYERPSASYAANKAFIVNRIGDAGFLVGLAIIWTQIGTFNFEEIFTRLRSPAEDGRGNMVASVGELIRLRASDTGTRILDPTGDEVALFPIAQRSLGFRALGEGPNELQQIEPPANPSRNDYGVMPYWLLSLAGVGIFLGCVGKSAQFPLHTWLPDAMEGPTPVSALIHAATMVAAGVYLVGRVYPLFTPEVLLLIAYVGMFTLFLAASIAVVLTDIKRVLAYSTVSQLGYMMLALGVGGWVGGLLHLVTHAFFKALLFLGAGSVIHVLHHEQDLHKMGGLYRKMRITALTMLVGVLAITGLPFLSGWYSKDRILADTMGFTLEHGEHFLLFVVPLLTAGLTAFYMFRLWFLAFSGTPRDEKVYEQAHESPWVMTLPLILLAVGSIGIAWGMPFWDAESSYLGKKIHEAEPTAVSATFAAEHARAEEAHLVAEALALLAGVAGFTLAYLMFYTRRIDVAAIHARFAGLAHFLQRKWYFDEAYDTVAVRPTLSAAEGSRRFDKTEDEQMPRSLDGVLSLPAWLLYRLGISLHAVQAGRIRGYVVVLVLTTLFLFAILSILGVGRSGG